MKKRFFFILFLTAVSLTFLALAAESQEGHKSKQTTVGSAASAAEGTPTYPSMPGPGKKVPIGSDYYLIYGFDKKPKLGTVIMKVEIFTKEGKKDTSIEVKADSGMPSMKGAHETGDRSFKLSKKGDYLLPIDIVMPGDWEVRVTLLKGGKVIFRGSYQFDV
jgi:nitrogen fixation protein FixH